jgi:hypothetical protein
LEAGIPEKTRAFCFWPSGRAFPWSEFLVHDDDQNAGRTQQSVRAGELVFFGNTFK